MPRHDYRCRTCGAVFEAVVAWDAYETACPSCGQPAERTYGGVQMVDDTLPGGPRYIHNMGDDPVWIETKTQYRAECQKRGLVQIERARYNRDDKSPWATKTCLRPGAHDPFLGKR